MTGESRPVSFYEHATTAATTEEFADLAERLRLRFDKGQLGKAKAKYGAPCAEVYPDLMFPDQGQPSTEPRLLCNGGLLNAADRSKRERRRDAITKPLLAALVCKNGAGPTSVLLNGQQIGTVEQDHEVSHGQYRAWRYTTAAGEQSPEPYSSRAEALIGLRAHVDPDVKAALAMVAINDATDDRSGVCPLREMCLQAALAQPERFGVWGGVSERQRRSILAKMRRATGARDESADLDDVPEHADDLTAVSAA